MAPLGSGTCRQRYLRWAIELIGVERLLFATDYPFLVAEQAPDSARRFLLDADLTDAEREQIASGNWEQLCAGIRR